MSPFRSWKTQNYRRLKSKREKGKSTSKETSVDLHSCTRINKCLMYAEFYTELKCFRFWSKFGASILQIPLEKPRKMTLSLVFIQVDKLPQCPLKKFLLVFFGKEHGTQLLDLLQHSGPQSNFLRLQYTDPLRKATQNDFLALVYTKRGTSSVPKEIFLSVFRQKYIFFKYMQTFHFPVSQMLNI